MTDDSNPQTEIHQPAVTYGVGATVLLYLSTFPAYEFVYMIHRRIFDSNQYSIYFDPPLSLLIVIGVALSQRPRLLTWSRWAPRLIDFAIAVPLGLVIIEAERILLSAKVYIKATDPFLVPVIIVGSVVEEVFLRGIILRSLRDRMPLWAAVAIVTCLAAIAHTNFWLAIPGQIALSLVYVSLEDSLAASIILHITFNSIALLPMGRAPIL